MAADAHFTPPFLENLPRKVMESPFGSQDAYQFMHNSLKAGHLRATADGSVLLQTIERLRNSEPVLARLLSNLESAGKLRAVEPVPELPSCFESIIMPKKQRELIGCSFAQSAEALFHDGDLATDKHELFMKNGAKPLFLSSQLHTGTIQILFAEKSGSVRAGEPFRWGDVLPPFRAPVTEIQILDPYFYVNIASIDLKALLPPLLRIAPADVSLSIISDASVSSTFTPQEVMDKVRETFAGLELPGVRLSLYAQKGSASALFHQRLLWTNLWTLQSDRGFDLTKAGSAGSSISRYDNNFLLTGRYTSHTSNWHYHRNRWDSLIAASDKVVG